MNSLQLLLQAGRAVDGMGLGRHIRRRAGRAQTFAEHRLYAPGDDLRHVDWHAVARKDALFVKVFEDESPVRLELVVDASGSMGFADKYRATAVLATAAAQATLRGGDEVGLHVLGQAVTAPAIRLVPPAAGRGHLPRIALALAGQQCAGPTPMAAALVALSHSLRRRSQVVIISDWLVMEPALPRALTALAARRHDVTLVQLWHPDEAALPRHGPARWTGLENDGARIGDSEFMRGPYAQAVAAHKRRLLAMSRHTGAALVTGLTTTPSRDLLAQVLRAHSRRLHAKSDRC